MAWHSFKKRCVAALSTKIEYKYLPECINTIRHYRQVLQELVEELKPSTIYENYQLDISWASSHLNRNKHVDLRYHICREAVADNRVKLSYCSTTELVGDILTKPLGLQKSTIIRDLLAMDCSLTKLKKTFE